MSDVTLESVTRSAEEVARLCLEGNLTEVQCREMISHFRNLKKQIGDTEENNFLICQCLFAEYCLELRLGEILGDRYKSG
jgi:hypothetical protein